MSPSTAVPAGYPPGVDESQRLAELILGVASGDHGAVSATLTAAPSLATARLTRRDEFFVAGRRAQVYAGDTALHAAAFAYDVTIARQLVSRGADVRARNRRGAEPLHAAVMGEPGSETWNPRRQRAVIRYLVDAGADPDAAALGGVTPLHRAVRNRCSAAVDELLRAGADAHAPNARGSTPSDLARRATGRGGVGSEQARAEQLIVIELLEAAAAH